MMKTLLAVQAHSEVEKTVHRHFPLWRKLGIPIVGFSPVDKIVQWPEEVLSLAVGLSGHSGVQSIERFCSMLETLNSPAFRRYDQVCLIEYDILIFGKIPDYDPGFWCDIGINSDSKFKWPEFALPPWIFTQEVGARLAKVGRQCVSRGDIEHGFYDRMLPGMVKEIGLEMRDIPTALTREFHSDPDQLLPAREGIRNGHYGFVHQVKSQAEFDFLTS